MSSPAPGAQTIPRRSRWLQFSLRGLIVLMALVAVGMAWVSYWQHRIHRQRVAIAQVRQLQNRIEKDLGSEIYRPIELEFNKTPWWLRLGGEPTIPVTTGVNLGVYRGTRILDSDLQMLVAFPYLMKVNVENSGVGGEGLSWVRPLQRMEMLNLSRTKVTDEDLQAVGELPALRRLILDELQLNGSGITNLANNSQLELLSLCDVPLRAEHIDHLNQLHALEELELESATLERLHLHDLKELWQAHITISAEQADLRFERLPKLESLFVLTDPNTSTQSLVLSELPALTDLTLGVFGPWPEQSGGSQTRQLMQQISRLRNLRKLEIYIDDIDDIDVRQLTQLPNLTWLSIGPCNVSNEGLRSIAQIKTLTELEIDSKSITTAGIQHLAHLPNLRSLRLKDSSHQEDPGAALLQLPALTHLTLGGCWYPSLTLTGENAAGRDIALNSISIHTPKGTSLLESEVKIRIAGLPSVESIHLTQPDADHFELALENLVHLRSLQINLSKGDEIHKFTLSKLPRLQNVNVFGEDSKIPAEALRRLRIWNDTRQVNIRGVEALEAPTNYNG